mgnify:CR=1 FL=1
MVSLLTLVLETGTQCGGLPEFAPKGEYLFLLVIHLHTRMKITDPTLKSFTVDYLIELFKSELLTPHFITPKHKHLSNSFI